MTLALGVSLLALLAACVAAWGALRARPLERIREQLLDELARQRRGAQGDLAAQLQPLLQAQHHLASELAGGREQQLRVQAEHLAQRFETLNQQLQDALRQARLEQGARLAEVQAMVQSRLEQLQASNEGKLEQMRLTVDEKLHATLDQRLGESFRLVSDRLELVQRGLGEMRTLAQDVGGLKRVLSNVKTRGVLGEAQLGSLLEQFLVPGQFERQRRLTPGSREAVDFAVRLPGPGQDAPVWIPIDAKFPLDDYQRLQDAQDRADLPALELAGKELEKRIVEQARSIREKYVIPPATTPFALMFLPTEGLYAEVLRRPGLFERVQAEHQVVVLGPATLCAFLNTIQVGFANLAISQRSMEAWKVLGEVKAEFRRFGEWIEAAQRKLQAASEEMDKVGTRTRQMERRLKDVEALPPALAVPPPEPEALGNQTI